MSRVLARFAQPGQEKKFVKMLNDSDKRLHVYAIKALEKITGESMNENQSTSVAEQRRRWLSRLDKNQLKSGSDEVF